MNTKSKIFLATVLLSFIILGVNMKPTKVVEDVSKLETDPSTLDRIAHQVVTIEIPKDTSEILNSFFPEGELKDKNLIRWKPDLEAQLHMHVAADGYCYSVLDTIIEIDSDADRKLYVFLTYPYQDELIKDECHPCAPNYSFGIATGNGDSLNIENFEKNVTTAGSWGEKAELKVKNLGSLHSLIEIRSGWTGMNTESVYVNLYDLNSFHYLLGYEEYHSDEMNIENQFFAEENLQETTTEMTTESNPNGSYDIVLTSKETAFDLNTEKVITRFTTKVYRWNENQQLELCYE